MKIDGVETLRKFHLRRGAVVLFGTLSPDNQPETASPKPKAPARDPLRSFRIPDEEWEAAKAAAGAAGVSVSSVVRDLLAAWVEDQQYAA